MSPRLLRRALLAVGLLVVVLAVWTAISGVLAARSLQQVQSLLDSEDGSPDAAVLAEAEQHVRRADELLQQPGPRVASRIPLAGRSVVAAQAVVNSGLVTVDSARSVLSAVEDRPLVVGGRIDLNAVRELHEQLRASSLALRPAMRRLSEVETGLVPPQLTHLVAQAQDRLLGADETAARAAGLTAVLPDMLGATQPRTMLIALQNNAELRATGGLISTYAIARAEQGRISVEPFRDVVEVADEADSVERVPAGPDYVGNYGAFLANSTLWKNVNMTPDVPTSHAVLAAVARRTTDQPVSLVMSLDIRGVTALTESLGSVTLPDGSELTADEMAEELYVTSYEGLEHEGSERRRVLRAAADRALARVLLGEAGPTSLIRSLARAAEGRHITITSGVAREQAALVAAGLAGEVDGEATDLALVTAHNLGGEGHLGTDDPGEGNKLDYYVKRSLDVSVTVGDDGYADVRQELRLENTAPAGLGPYVAGFTVPGRLRSLLSLYASGDAEDVVLTREGNPTVVELTAEHGATVARTVSELDRGEASTWQLRYRVPLAGPAYALKVVPQPLAQDAEVTVRVTGAPGVRVEGRAAAGGAFVAGPVELDTVLDRTLDVRVRVQRDSDTLADRVRDLVGLG